MIFSTHTKEILALHYVYPLPLHKLLRLLSPDDLLKDFHRATASDIATALQMPVQKAEQLMQSYRRSITMPLEEAYAKADIVALPYTHPFYPRHLFELVNPPAVLYVKGKLSLLTNTKRVAIIGSRKATSYSKTAMDYILPPLIEKRYTIVSGLAKGADTLAHVGALKYGGQTIAVLGHGFHHLYPKENAELANKIASEHLLLTEYPPYMKPEKWHFPMRNRIISGLSQALVVTESTLRSGTLITTELALEQGKDVFVVPGPIDSEQSQGTNKLLIEGAIPVVNGYQIVEMLELFSSKY
ncbi:MAG: DNA-processing protein DprA [Lysinibacillus sp.]